MSIVENNNTIDIT